MVRIIRKLVTMAMVTKYQSYIFDQMYYQVICGTKYISKWYVTKVYLTTYIEKLYTWPNIIRSHISDKRNISQNILKNYIFDQSTFDLLAFNNFGTELGAPVKKVPWKLYIWPNIISSPRCICQNILKVIYLTK